MVKMFTKIVKSFVEFSTMIVAIRRHTLILHLEAKYAEIDCKNGIYAKNWVRNTMVLKTDTMKKPKKGLVTGFLLDRGLTGGQTGDTINNLINNFKIIKI